MEKHVKVAIRVRERLEMTQRELAKDLGVHQSLVGRFETGLVDDPMAYLLRLKPKMLQSEANEALDAMVSRIRKKWL